MRILIYLTIMISGMILLNSCGKDDVKVPMIRIDSETNFVDGAQSDYNMYVYDNSGRLVSTTYIATSTGAFTVDTIIYQDGIVLDKSYVNRNDTPYVYKNYLNNLGYVDSVEYFFNNKMYSSGSFAYDDLGHLVSERMYSNDFGIDYTYSAVYTITNGNRTRAIFSRAYEFVSPDTTKASIQTLSIPRPSLFTRMNDSERRLDIKKALRISRNKIVKTKYENKDTSVYYYNDTLNTISAVNRGIFWDGKQNKNVVKIQQRFVEGKVYTYYYNYILDVEDRITRQTIEGSAIYKTNYSYRNDMFEK